MSDEPDYMLTCDHPGCGVRYSHPNQEPLRGMGARGVRIARAWADLDGWSSDGATDLDMCPEHAPVRGE